MILVIVLIAAIIISVFYEVMTGNRLSSDLWKAARKSQIIFIAYIIGVMAITVTLFTTCASYYELHDTTITIVSKERVASNDVSAFMVWTDSGVFTVSDSLIYWKWYSADTYGKLDIDEMYNVTYYGWRFGPLSMFPNIISAEEIQ